MAQPKDAGPNTRTSWADVARGWNWARGGWAYLQGDLPLWLCMAAIYIAVVMLLQFIPFAGFLLVILLTVIALAGTLLALHHGVGAIPTAPVERWAKWPTQQLLRGISSESYVYPVALLSIVTLGLFVLVFIIEHLFNVTSLGGLLSSTARRTFSLWSILIGVAIALIINLALTMALFFSVHRTVLAGRDPIMAVHESFNACIRHAIALLGLIGVFVAPWLVIVAGFFLSPIVGLALLFTLGSVVLPTFVAASYCSYSEIFGLAMRA
ncbi:MAG: hypothetical protein HY308_14325 [Gammaproteobacteria bacterium]|nr:hypothetical protein [Gammaproteobacteria bacterium]